MFNALTLNMKQLVFLNWSNVTPWKSIFIFTTCRSLMFRPGYATDAHWDIFLFGLWIMDWLTNWLPSFPAGYVHTLLSGWINAFHANVSPQHLPLSSSPSIAPLCPPRHEKNQTAAAPEVGVSESATTVFLSVFRQVPRIEQRSQHVEWKLNPRGSPVHWHPLFRSSGT